MRQTISQDEIARLQSVEHLLRLILLEFRTRVACGDKQEPGPLSLNYSALYFPIPRLAVDPNEKDQDLLPIPETVEGSNFEVLSFLLSEEEIEELHSEGHHKLAENKRRMNRKLYRAFLDLYISSTFAAFTRDVAFLSATKSHHTDPIIADVFKIRYWTTVLWLLPWFHKFRIGRPDEIVTKALRKIDHIISPIKIVGSGLI